jgi:hypothetical protein
MKILYIINVDFALVHFLLPLMREAGARGHEVAAICAEGPLLAAARAEDFRILPAPLIRRLAPAAGRPVSPNARSRAHQGATAVHRPTPTPRRRQTSSASAKREVRPPGAIAEQMQRQPRIERAPKGQAYRPALSRPDQQRISAGTCRGHIELEKI